MANAKITMEELRAKSAKAVKTATTFEKSPTLDLKMEMEVIFQVKKVVSGKFKDQKGNPTPPSTWTKLAKTAEAGSTSIEVLNAADWQNVAGVRVVPFQLPKAGSGTAPALSNYLVETNLGQSFPANASFPFKVAEHLTLRVKPALWLTWPRAISSDNPTPDCERIRSTISCPM